MNRLRMKPLRRHGPTCMKCYKKLAKLEAQVNYNARACNEHWEAYDECFDNADDTFQELLARIEALEGK